MKILHLFPILAALSLIGTDLLAELNVPGDGSDGAFAPSTNVQIDLSQAVTSAWDANNTANAGKGVYDAAKWAVVFKYTSVNIPAGVKVTFKNHPSRAPVVWLVKGDVSIAGIVSLDSTPGSSIVQSEPGPGGFRGGVAPDGANPLGAGFGPGGANSGSGTYATMASGAIYGNTKILPLIGGSGGSGSYYIGGSSPSAGTGGGGAILIASRNRVTVDGSINCRSAPNSAVNSRTGSGGAARIIASELAGRGMVDVRSGGDGGHGRIRLETPNYSAAINFQPTSIVVPPDNPVQIWPSGTSPTCRIVSVAGVVTPADPSALLNAPGADVIFPGGGSVPIVVETAHMPTNSTVTVRIVPVRGDVISVNATLESGNQQSATWTATANVPSGHSAIQVRALAP